MRAEIRISDCVHYRGFRYGGFGNNIYEDYLVGFAAGESIRLLRRTLVDRVLAYRGGDFSSALGVDLDRCYVPWRFPWVIGSVRRAGGVVLPQENLDIICHFSSSGVLASHLNREFFWLERAYEAIGLGYRPNEFGYCQVMALKRGRCTRYLVVDGNHRIAAMHAHGIDRFRAEVISPMLWSRERAFFWPGVLAGVFSLSDARKIFDRYFWDENPKLPIDRLQKVLMDEPLDMVGKVPDDDRLIPGILRKDRSA